jgi:hypothetical protein
MFPFRIDSTQNPDRPLRIGRAFAALVLVLFLGSPLVLAAEGESEDDDPFFLQRGIDDRGAFFIGAVASSVDSVVRIDPDFGVGSSLQLQRIFNVDRDRTYARFGGYWRFSRKHRLNFQYLRTSSSGTNTLLDEEITIAGEVIELNAAIGAEEKTGFAALEYRYAFVNNGRAEAGLSAGLGVIDTDLTVFGEVTVGPFTEIAAERVSETIPLPVVGIYTDFRLTRGLFLSVDALILNANYDKYSGSIDDSRIALRWYPTKVFGFGAAWNRTRIDIKIAEPDGDIYLDYLFEGPSVFISFLVPGMK